MSEKQDETPAFKTFSDAMKHINRVHAKSNSRDAIRVTHSEMFGLYAIFGDQNDC